MSSGFQIAGEGPCGLATAMAQPTPEQIQRAEMMFASPPHSKLPDQLPAEPDGPLYLRSEADHRVLWESSEEFRLRQRQAGLQLAATRLALPIETVLRFRVGWWNYLQATTWPIVDADGKVVGIRYRQVNSDTERAMRGSRAGLFFADDLPQRIGWLYVVEGPTNAAALDALGFAAVGVTSFTNCSQHLVNLCNRLQVNHVGIVPDQGEPGRIRVGQIVNSLSQHCHVEVTKLPRGFPDIRTWLTSGVSLPTVLKTFDSCYHDSLLMEAAA